MSSFFAILVFVTIGTPLTATLFYELYHLLEIELIYTSYSVARYLSANFMMWEGRWLVSAMMLVPCVVWFSWSGWSARSRATRQSQ